MIHRIKERENGANTRHYQQRTGLEVSSHNTKGTLITVPWDKSFFSLKVMKCYSYMEEEKGGHKDYALEDK